MCPLCFRSNVRCCVQTVCCLSEGLHAGNRLHLCRFDFVADACLSLISITILFFIISAQDNRVQLLQCLDIYSALIGCFVDMMHDHFAFAESKNIIQIEQLPIQLHIIIITLLPQMSIRSQMAFGIDLNYHLFVNWMADYLH